MKWKCGNGCNHFWTIAMILEILLTTCVLLVASQGEDAVAEEISHFPQYSFPHHHTAPHFRRELSHQEQKDILRDIQHNNRFQQPVVDPRSPTNSHVHPFSILQQHQYAQQQDLRVVPQQPNTGQQSSALFLQPQSAIATHQSPILLSLQQSPLSSPQFLSLFSEQPQTQSEAQYSPLSAQPSPVLLSLQNSPLSLHQSTGLFSPQPQTLRNSQESQQAPDTSHQLKSPLSTQQSPVITQVSKSNQPKVQLTTQEPKTEEHSTDIKALEGTSNTEFTIQRSISDPVELRKVQLLELQREQERKERLKKLQEEQLRLIQEENERRLKEREEEEKRDEERRLKLQEQLRKIQEEKEKRRKQQEQEQLRLIQERKERLLKQQQEEQLRIIQEKERQKKEEEEEEEELRQIEERKQNEEKQQQEPSLSSAIYSQSTPPTKELPQEIILQPSLDKQRPRQRARIVEEPDPSVAPEELFLQNERQKLYYQLKEAQQQQEKRLQAADYNQQTEESQQVTRNNQRPANHIVRTKPDQGSTQQSKLSQLEKQLHQKQLQEQLQKQFQLQLLQRQDLLRQLKLAVSNSATPTKEDQIVPGPIAISAGNTSAPLYLANGQKIQVVQSQRQGRPLTEIMPRNGLSTTPSISTTTQRPPRALLEELTKGVLPPGADFEVIRHKQDGALEEVGKQLPQNLPQKKVTFVFLEEQTDGSFKVKGVRGNNDGNIEGDQPAPAGDVESIIKRIQEGDLKLPPPSTIPVEQQSTIPQLPTTLPPTKVPPPFIPQSTSNLFPPTPKPNSIIKTVSSSLNFQSHQTTAKPNTIKTVSSNLNFQGHPGMEFIQSVTLPPLYDVDSTVQKTSITKSQINKQAAETSLLTTHLNSPYSVEAHPTGENVAAPIFPQQSLGPTNSYIHKSQQSNVPSGNAEQIIPQYQQKINSVTSYPAITQFSPTIPDTTYFSPNKHSPSPVPQFTTSAPRKKSQSLEPFLPTDPSFVNPHQPYSPFFASETFPKQTDHQQETPGIIYTNPTTQLPLLTTNAPVQQDASKHQSSDYTDKLQDFQQNVEAPSLKTPTRVAAPSSQDILKEPGRIVPLDEDGSVEYQTKVEEPLSLSEVLKKEGLFAMARFLRESGLNNMLNDTGPYTVFAPTDKAFRALLVQLGGPEKAEEKFRENPRLLSGLLLHHVIPGSFELSSLQDEMTGVSLAGTQLRVNTYSIQDVEWNDVQVVTINGARVSRDKHDIPIPQGIAHAVDRVMFPLPVGNIVQTLRSDRERRFNKFLRAIQASGIADTFTGNKVYTMFAPTDRAFSVVDSDDLDKLLTEKEMARALVLRHTIPGALYTAGMRFYQLRDSMEKGSSIVLHKTNGHVKANSASVVTQNIPATNGVIHAIDGLL